MTSFMKGPLVFCLVTYLIQAKDVEIPKLAIKIYFGISIPRVMLLSRVKIVKEKRFSITMPLIATAH